MKCWTPFFLLSLLWASALAAYTNQELQDVLVAKGKNGAIPISDENYKKVLNGERDYHLILFLTSKSPQVNCLLCSEFAPHYETVAKSYMSTYPNGVADDGKNVYFLVSELSDSKKLFKMLQLESIPKVYHYPPSAQGVKATAPPAEFREYEFYHGDHVDMFSKWVTAITGNSIDIHIPVDHNKIAMNALATFVAVFALRPYRARLMSMARSPIIWGIVSIVLIIMCLTGLMFNQIKNPPYLRDEGKGVEFFAPSPQMQYMFETQALAPLYGLIGIFFLVLVVRVPKITDPKVQFLASVIVSACFYLLCGIFLNIFGLKYAAYPYRFFDYLRF